MLVGCDVGILNFSKIKGVYIVMKLGMIVVDVIFEVFGIDVEEKGIINF